MANLILKNSSVVTSGTPKAPTITDLAYGELAINYAAGRLYYKKADNSIDYFLSAANTTLDVLTGPVNYGRATVASAATTSDIWAVTGNQIDFTGTVTVTAFPTAPKAGTERVLVCAGSCGFTAGSNMLIDGFPSGRTLVCSANDIVMVRAISTTQFRLSYHPYVVPGTHFDFVVASEALSAGNLVNVWDNAGTTSVRKADASSSAKYANGYVLRAYNTSDVATVFFHGVNDKVSALSAGLQYLSASSAGACTTTPPSGSGQLVQIVGVSFSATKMAFQFNQPIQLA